MEPARFSFNFYNLSPDVRFEIFSQLPVKDLLSLSRSNKSLLKMINTSEPLWKLLFIKNFKGYYPSTINPITYKNIVLANRNLQQLSDLQLRSSRVYLITQTKKYHFHNGVHYELKNGAIVRTAHQDVKKIPTQDKELHRFYDSYFGTSQSGVSYSKEKAVSLKENDRLAIWKDSRIVFTLDLAGFYQFHEGYVTCREQQSEIIHTWDLNTQQHYTFKSPSEAVVVGIKNDELIMAVPSEGFRVLSLKEGILYQKCRFPIQFKMSDCASAEFELNDRFFMTFDRENKCWVFPLSDVSKGIEIKYSGDANKTRPVLHGNYIYFLDKNNPQVLVRFNLDTHQSVSVFTLSEFEITKKNIKKFVVCDNRVVVCSRQWVYLLNDLKMLTKWSVSLNQITIQFGHILEIIDHNLLLVRDITDGKELCKLAFKYTYYLWKGLIVEVANNKVGVYNLLYVAPKPNQMAALSRLFH